MSRLRAASLILAGLCLTLGAALSLSGAVLAAEVCDLYSAVVAHLSDKYGETRTAYGIGTNGEVVEVFENEKKDTWTITVTAPGGLTCLVAAGAGWRKVPPGHPRRPEMDS